ncbi:VanZ family protein [Streptomyces panaciradicis]|uniref:VanZ family protein n=1 Tax=Streptomyces panaciradicis TaxID=1470261 RepID=UPI00201CB150|nr:VanZ family protein [Streptomyces panaciradicis]MCL6671717.1 VanZ family protein [Streptomyces panaciradicis]
MARAAARPLSALRLRTAKAEKPVESAQSTKKTKSVRSAQKAKARPAPRPEPRERHVLPWPIRVLAMLVAFGAMVAFAVVLAKLTLEPSPASASLVHTNLHPGRSIRAYMEQPALRDTVKQIGGNILLGVPFGVLVPVVAPRARGLLRVLLLTAVVMLLVEFAQGALVNGRAFDIDDVILNTTGALIGWLLLGRRMGKVHAKERVPARPAKRTKSA